MKNNELYQKMYCILFSDIEEIVSELERDVYEKQSNPELMLKLIETLQKCENTYADA